MSAEPSRRFGWPQAFAAVAVAAILAGAVIAIYFFNFARRAPEAIVDGGKEILAEVREIARAFHTGTVTTSFVSYASEVTGSNYLQFATLEQMEVFEREDRASTLWGTFDLPEVVVEARAPVQYTYFLDLDKEWNFELVEDAAGSGTVRVVAPKIEFNKPAIDASALDYRIRAGSVFRDEDAALESLRAGLTNMAHWRARENVELVRELGRRKTAEFIDNWLLQRFGEESRSYRVEVVFADEKPGGLVIEETAETSMVPPQ